MDYRTYSQRLDYILELLQKGRFGTLESAAKRFNVSTRTIKRMLQALRAQGHQIEYSKELKKYFIKIPE